MKDNKTNRSSKVLNASLILFSFCYCWLFYKQWLLMVPLFILGTRGDIKILVFNTSIIYFFCLFTNWLNIILLSLCFSFYLLINRLVQFFILNDNINYFVSIGFVCTLLSRLESEFVLIDLSYALFCISFVFVFDWIYQSFLIYLGHNKYWLEVVSIQLSADQKMNGDYFDTLELDNHQYLFLSDGMGQGKKALKISESIVKRIKSFLKRGYNLNEAIELANEVIIDDENIFASLDAIDCFSSKVDLYKKGAENSYLIRENEVRKLNKNNLPMGIEDDNFQSLKYQIAPNDILLLCSDGVTLSYPRFEEELILKKDENELVKWIESVSINSRKTIKDDFSIILVKFNEKKEDL